MTLTREQGWALVCEWTHGKALERHGRAVERVMRAGAPRHGSGAAHVDFVISALRPHERELGFGAGDPRA